MALQAVPGHNPFAGFGGFGPLQAFQTQVITTLDAANEALICYGHWFWEDGGSHTVDTSGSSKLLFRTGTVTFANGSTTVKVGLGDVQTGGSPPARAAHSSNVITFGVNFSGNGGGGGLSGNTLNSKTPTTGSKTIAHGDLVAFSVQMTARAGADTVGILSEAHTQVQAPSFPGVTNYVGAAYAAGGIPMCMAIASDGTRGCFFGSGMMSGSSGENLASNTSPDEIGNVFRVPFPAIIVGYQVAAGLSNTHDYVVYGDPFGTPVAIGSRTHTYPQWAHTSDAPLIGMFATPIEIAANTDYVICVKPTTASSFSLRVATPGDAAWFDVMSLGDDCYYASRTDAGTFSGDTSKRAAIAPILGGFSDGVGSSPIANLKQFGRGAPY